MRANRIDKDAIENARKKSKSLFKENQGLDKLNNEELSVFLADVVKEIYRRNDRSQFLPGLKRIPMIILGERP